MIEVAGGDLDTPAEPDDVLTRPLRSLASDDEAHRTRRDRIQAAGLASGRIPSWTTLPGSALWDEWCRRFDGNADLALDAALRLARRMAGQRCAESQRQLRLIERALLRDAVPDVTEPEPVEPEAESRLPLPFTGLMKMLRHLAWARTALRIWERDAAEEAADCRS